jgi:hypothetical protein
VTVIELNIDDLQRLAVRRKAAFKRHVRRPRRELSSRLRESHPSWGKYRFAGSGRAVNLNGHLRRRFIMAAKTADGALLLVKKLGGVVLILVGVIGIAVGLEYRTIGFSAGITGAGIVALTCGMALLALKIIRRNTS